jgi:DNA-binding transcriptional MocR family regulator
VVKRTEDDARKDPQPGDEFQYSHAGLIYWRSIVRLTFDLRKRRVVNYHEQNIDNEDWYAECLLTSWRRWAKRIGVTVERVQQAGGDDANRGRRPPRPKEDDEAVVKESFRRLAKQVIEWSEEEDDDLDEVAELLEDCEDDDGYQFARNLERDHGYSPDSELVEILDGYLGCLHSAHMAAVAKWREVNRVSAEEDLEIQAREKSGEKSDKSG